MNITQCLLTGERLSKSAILEGANYIYNHPIPGKVKISKEVVELYQASNDFNHPTLTAICRDAYEKGVEPPIINSAFLNHTIKTLAYPQSFKEKVTHLLKWLYNHGGDDFKPNTFDVDSDFIIAFAINGEEFNRIMEYLEKKFWIEWSSSAKSIGGGGHYFGVLLTDYGLEEVQKELPNIPMIGLVEQSITTGNAEIDEKLNQAKKLFFDEPASIHNMRSACEVLCFVLEPLRKELIPIFTVADVNMFFELVNKFDIRHNKDTTMRLVYEEQLEWVFYTLLNTINTYTKLRDRLKP